MTVKLQILSLIFSFFYGCGYCLLYKLLKKHLKTNIILNLIFVLLNVLFYFYGLIKIQGGILHIYMIFALIIGYIFVSKIKR